MPLTQVPLAQAQAILESVTEHTRLTAVVRTLAREVERLEEDNRQLRAAIEVYRSVVRRYALKAS
jgi:hypothetical protein